jgi:hypothetical protein
LIFNTLSENNLHDLSKIINYSNMYPTFIKYTCLVFCLVVASLSLTQNAQAQQMRRSKALKPRTTEGYISAGLQLNAINYTGDIPSGPTFTRPGIGAFISRKVSPKLHVQLGAAWGRIEGDDISTDPSSGTYARNLHFRNDIKELSLLAQWDLIGSYGKHFRRKGFTPYLFAGIAVFHNNPQAKIPTSEGDAWVNLQPLGTEGQGRPGYEGMYSKIQIAVPVGIGFKIKLDERWDMGIETGVRFTFFDYLDDVSGEYPEMADLGDPLAIALSNRSLETTAARTGEIRSLDAIAARFGAVENYTGFDGRSYRTVPSFRRGQSTRGNPNSKDMYFVTGIRLSYIINVGLKCPQFRW